MWAAPIPSSVVFNLLKDIYIFISQVKGMLSTAADWLLSLYDLVSI